MKLVVQAAFFAVGSHAMDQDYMQMADGLRGAADADAVDDDDFNEAYINVFRGIMDLWQINADISTTNISINQMYLDLASAYMDGSDPSDDKKAMISEDIGRIQSDVAKIVDANQTYVEDVAKLENDVNALFIDKQMGGLGNYLAVVKLQTKTMNEIKENIFEIDLIAKSFDDQDLSTIEMKLQVLEANLMELLDAIANSIVAMRATLAEFGDEEVQAGPIPYVSLNARALVIEPLIFRASRASFGEIAGIIGDPERLQAGVSYTFTLRQ